jgi:hypothetical protein
MDGSEVEENHACDQMMVFCDDLGISIGVATNN